MRVTDRRTDIQNYDPQDRASIAASRGKTGQAHEVQQCTWIFRSSVKWTSKKISTNQEPVFGQHVGSPITFQPNRTTFERPQRMVLRVV